MADLTPVDAAAAVLPDSTVNEMYRRDSAQRAIAAALGAVDLVRVLAEARHPHLWTGKFAELLRRMPKTFPTEALVQESVQKKQAEALKWAEVEAAAVRAALGVAPQCPVCGSTTPGSSTSCDCDAHRNANTPVEGTDG